MGRQEVRSRLSGLSLVAGCVLLSGPGCLAPPEYDEIRATCGLMSDQYEAQAYSASTGESSLVTRDCALDLARAIGLDWRSFGEEAREFQTPDTTVQFLLAGLRTLVTSRSLSRNELLEASVEIPVVMADLMQAAEFSGIGPTDTFGEAWYDYIVERIGKTTYGGAGAGGEGDALMRSLPGGQLQVYDLRRSEEQERPWNASLIAASLVHEARHKDGYVHEPCASSYPNYFDVDDPYCDLSPDGPYGLQAIWAYSWWNANQQSLGSVGIGEGIDTMFRGCAYINEASSYWICLDAIQEGYLAMEAMEE